MDLLAMPIEKLARIAVCSPHLVPDSRAQELREYVARLRAPAITSSTGVRDAETRRQQVQMTPRQYADGRSYRVQVGPRGGRYTMATAANGRPYRAYF